MHSYLALTAASTNLNFASAFFFKLLLCGSTWANDLSNIVDWRIIWVWNINSFVLFGWFVVWWSHILRVHYKNLGNQSIPLSHILVLVSLLFGVHSKTSLRVVYRFWARWSDVSIGRLPVLHCYSSLQIVDSMTPYKQNMVKYTTYWAKSRIDWLWNEEEQS